MKLLVTGGAGYIGSHTSVKLLEAGYDICIVDNFINSSSSVIDRIKAITNKNFDHYEVDITNKDDLKTVFYNHKFDAVIHFAGLKAVGESVEKPLMYYRNNVIGTIVLLELMQKHCVNKIVFSSSATVYGQNNKSPYNESMPTSATNPYGQTKLIIENILHDCVIANKDFTIMSLRYFNPIGAHKSGMIGENPRGIPNNLMPYITQVVQGKLAELKVFGDDYDTADGTGVRDYIHVDDLANGHLLALEKIFNVTGEHIYNLGTGKGYSVLEVINAFEKANGVKVKYAFTNRRNGDIATCYADVTKAKNELAFIAKKDLFDMCKDSYNWQMSKFNTGND